MYEGSLCVCCMSTENLTQLYGCGNQDEEQNFAKLLSASLNIQLSEDDGHDSICDVCVKKLNTCVDFKKQVLRSISILTSVEISQLLAEDELRVLGLTKYDKHLNENDIFAKDENNIFDKGEAPEVDDNTENTISNLDQVQTIESPKSPSGKAGHVRRGRPRIHPPDSVPYEIARDELMCRECGENFPNNITLKIHYNSHFGGHKCATCGKGFMTYTSLKKHQDCHLQGPFDCRHCDRQFACVNSVRAHERAKHGGGAFACARCPRRLRSARARARHLATVHAGDRSYVCRYCQKSFRDSGARWKHVASAHETRRAACPACGARCPRPALRKHMRRHLAAGDGTTERNSDTERRFVCKLCSKAFTQKKNLKYHVDGHSRRGEYAGDPSALMLDTRVHQNHTGIMSESEATEEHLDESLRSETPDYNSDGKVETSVIEAENIDERLNLQSFDASILDDEMEEIYLDFELT